MLLRNKLVRGLIMRLTDVSEGKTVYIKYIAVESNEAERLKSLGISGGGKIKVLYSNKRTGCVVVAGGDPVGLSRGVCERTEVE